MDGLLSVLTYTRVVSSECEVESSVEMQGLTSREWLEGSGFRLSGGPCRHCQQPLNFPPRTPHLCKLRHALRSSKPHTQNSGYSKSQNDGARMWLHAWKMTHHETVECHVLLKAVYKTPGGRVQNVYVKQKSISWLDLGPIPKTPHDVDANI